jgi:hypothetical protein
LSVPTQNQNREADTVIRNDHNKKVKTGDDNVQDSAADVGVKGGDGYQETISEIGNTKKDDDNREQELNDDGEKSIECITFDLLKLEVAFIGIIAGDDSTAFRFLIEATVF